MQIIRLDESTPVSPVWKPYVDLSISKRATSRTGRLSVNYRLTNAFLSSSALDSMSFIGFVLSESVTMWDSIAMRDHSFEYKCLFEATAHATDVKTGRQRSVDLKLPETDRPLRLSAVLFHRDMRHTLSNKWVSPSAHRYSKSMFRSNGAVDSRTLDCTPAMAILAATPIRFTVMSTKAATGAHEA